MKLDVSSLAHTKWECKYHIVFAPKYRRQIIYGKIKQDIGQMLRKLCEYKGIEIHEAEACKEHIHIEANQKHGRGYQVHIVIDGIVDSTMADEPFSLYDALGGAQFTLEAVNKERGTNYLLPDVLLVSREAAMAERQTDFLSAKLLRENSSKTGPWLTIREKQRPEGCITACEAICLAYAAAREDHKPKGNNVCMAFCRHLAAKRYGGSALELYNALMRQPTTDMGYAWIRRAFQAVDIGAAEIQQWFAAE